MSVILHSDCFPDHSKLIGRSWFKNQGLYTAAGPALVTFCIASMVASGGQGQDPGGNAAYSETKFKIVPGEVLQLQVGATGTGGNPGNSFVKRVATGEVVCFADRGRGTGGVQGSALFCIGDNVEGGVAATRSGGDLARSQRLGFGGRFAANLPTRACGPGGGGLGLEYPQVNIVSPAGQGCIVLEFYAGDPGF